MHSLTARARAQIDGTIYFIPADGGATEGFVSWDGQILSLDDGSGNPDCIFLQLVTDNHIRIVILDSVAVRERAGGLAGLRGGLLLVLQ